MKLVSITAPAFNEGAYLKEFIARIVRVMRGLPYRFEIVIVENGSTDDSLKILKELALTTPELRYVSLSRNYGHQGGLLAGLSYSQGDAVITLDADGQHPPEVIPQLLEQWQKGFLVVHTTKKSSQASILRRLTDKAFYSLIRRLTGIEMAVSDFRLIDRKVLNSLLGLSERDKFLRGLIPWLGFSQTSVGYEAQIRKLGETKFKPKDLFELAVLGVTSFTQVPLRLLLRIGVMILIPSSLYFIYVLVAGTYSFFFTESTTVPTRGWLVLPPGWATLTATVIFFGSVQLIGMGILGEYLGRVYSETKKRPNFIVAETSSETIEDQRLSKKFPLEVMQ